MGLIPKRNILLGRSKYVFISAGSSKILDLAYGENLLQNFFYYIVSWP